MQQKNFNRARKLACQAPLISYVQKCKLFLYKSAKINARPNQSFMKAYILAKIISEIGCVASEKNNFYF